MPTRVLIADDNVDAAESLAMLLQFDGYETLVAHDGREALERARTFAPAVALLDLGMPLLDGLALAQAIRAAEWGRDIRLVAVTGWTDDASRRRTRDAGFDFHIAKPIAFDELARILSSCAASGETPAR